MKPQSKGSIKEALSKMLWTLYYYETGFTSSISDPTATINENS